jgi:uncharacterized membrane protein
MPKPGLLYDFGAYLASGAAVLAGQNPYDPQHLSQWAGEQGILFTAVNLNSPASLPVFQLFARFESNLAFGLWLTLNTGCYLTSVVWMARRFSLSPAQLAFALLNVGFWTTFAVGQSFGVLTLLATAACLTFRQRPYLAGAAIGLMVALKPLFLVVLALSLLSRQWRVVVCASLTAAIVGVVPGLLFGFQVYVQWFEVLQQVEWIAASNNISVIGLTHRSHMPLAGPIAAVVLLAVAAWRAYRNIPEQVVVPLGLAAALVVSPITWSSYSVILVPVLLSRRWRAMDVVVAVMLSSPTTFSYQYGGVWTISYTMGMLILFASLLTRPSDTDFGLPG